MHLRQHNLRMVTFKPLIYNEKGKENHVDFPLFFTGRNTQFGIVPVYGAG